MYKHIMALIFCTVCGGAQASIGSWIEPNLGQADAAVKAIARDGGLTLLLEPQRARVLLPHSGTVEVGDEPQAIERKWSSLIELVIHGADPAADMVMGEPTGAVSRYFRGNDPEAWVAGIAHHNRVRFTDVYPGIDLVYRLRGARIEYDFEVAAGADLSQIRLSVTGVDDVSIDAGGNLVATTAGGEFRQRAPEVFRDTGTGRQPVPGAFRIDGDMVGFEIDAADGEHKLVIDPVIEFAGSLGGSDFEQGSDIALNSRGNLVVSGTTRSLDIPGAGAGYTLGLQDLFFAEIERSTGQLLWITFMGGAGSDWSDSMAVDSQGDIVAVGYTESADFPTVNAFQSTFVGCEDPLIGIDWDGIVVKLNDDGSRVVFATYYGGLDWAQFERVGFEWFRGLAIDGNDHIFVAGQTSAPDFPVTTLFRGAGCMENDAASDAFFLSDMTLVEFAPDGTRLFATCIGATDRDAGRDLAIGPDGRLFIGGFGRSIDFPTSAGAFQPSTNGSFTPLIVKLDQARTDVDWATYVGGTDVELLQEFAVDVDGTVVGSGFTESVDFPVTANALQSTPSAGPGQDIEEAFVFKLSNDGTTLQYGSYFGGAGSDAATATQIDDLGRVYFAGTTDSRDLIERTSLQPGPRPLFGASLTVDTGAVNAIANASLTMPGFGNVPAAIVARDGVNRYHKQLFDDEYFSLDVGVESADSVDVVADFFGGSEGFSDVFFVNSFAEHSVYLALNGQYVFARNVGSGSTDARAAATISEGHVVVANFGQHNEIYVGAAGAPLPVGRPDGNTVDVLTGDFGGLDSGADIVFANQGQDISLLRNTGFPNYGSAVPLSLASPNVSALAAGDIDGDDETDLVIANKPGPLQYITFNAGFPGPVQEIPSSLATTNAVFLFDADQDGDLDLFAGNDGPDGFYYNDGAGNFTAASELPVVDAMTPALTVDCIDTFGTPPLTCEPWVGTDDGLQRYKLSVEDIYVAVIDPDTGTLEFSSYLDSGAADSFLRGLTLADGGRILLIGNGAGDAWPVPDGTGATASTVPDAVFVEIDIDIDDDTVIDGSDNCLDVANPLQRDTDNDAYGNFCDPDLNNDGAVNFADLQLFKQRFFGTDPDADLNGDGRVNFVDLQIAKGLIFGSPGPSGLLLP